MIKLFSKTSESIDGPSGNNENSYNYYHKSNRKDIEIIRVTLESWFSKYPESEKIELKSRFRKDLDSAFFELFLFEMFRKLGFNITIHPKLENSNKRPDFLVSKDGFQAYIEAKICLDKTEEEMSFERRQNEFYDQLSKVKIRGFLLRIEKLNFKSQKQPRVKELITKIELEVNKLDSEEIRTRVEKYGFDGCPNIKFENKDFKISIQPLPLNKSKKDKISKNPIGMFPIETFWGGGENSLRQSILKKAKRYGKFEVPFLICINALGKISSGKIDIENVIWGSLKYSYSTNPENKDVKITRNSDGIFYNSGKEKLKNVTGIMVTKVFPSNIPNSKYWLFENPFARNKFDFEKLNLVYNYLNGNEIISRDGSDFDEIFGISKDWLN
ncbi:hypothetical protein K8354_15445 [Polaribacter litorisediminis]|uniref:hypothetical protein n=1 Tax=Polaribacter litorisediminis TaxID=1908341 RepID=UPI001CBBCCF6|nr:hypothetical protein [Polaribacter litorisediminis]UAM97676.1 hypothetical protein K8354_15445 [Polaribacter litorisediminis]